jgi:hypothetical protein
MSNEARACGRKPLPQHSFEGSEESQERSDRITRKPFSVAANSRCSDKDFILRNPKNASSLSCHVISFFLPLLISYQLPISLVLTSLLTFFFIGLVITQTVSHRLPAAAAGLRALVRSYGICGGQSGTSLCCLFLFLFLFLILFL